MRSVTRHADLSVPLYYRRRITIVFMHQPSHNKNSPLLEKVNINTFKSWAHLWVISLVGRRLTNNWRPFDAFWKVQRYSVKDITPYRDTLLHPSRTFAKSERRRREWWSINIISYYKKSYPLILTNYTLRVYESAFTLNRSFLEFCGTSNSPRGSHNQWEKSEKTYSPEPAMLWFSSL